MSHPPAVIQADFDRLAEFAEEQWNHNNHYHGYLLRHVPTPCAQALDIGCGAGIFTRLLARRADQVVGIDLSPNMIRVAQTHLEHPTNVRYEVADVLTIDLPTGTFDCVASIATLHHLPLDTILLKMKEALAPGGVLLVLDLFQNDGIKDPRNMLAVPASLLLRLIHRRGLRESRAKRAAWAAHGAHDHYLPLREIRRICAATLPGAVVTQHLMWRYSIVWTKPAH